MQQLDIQLKKIGTVLSTRWVASSVRTVEAVWNDAAHYKVCSDPTSADYKRELGIFLEDRFSSDASLNLEPLAEIDQNVSDKQLKHCHESLVLNQSQFCMQYRDATYTIL